MMPRWMIRLHGHSCVWVCFHTQCFKLPISSYTGSYALSPLHRSVLTQLRATHVPVGEDQKQHLEFSRYTANSFNHLYGPIFPIPEPLICKSDLALPNMLSMAYTLPAPAKRVMSLKEPALKMSKSHVDDKSRIILTDSPAEIHKKIKVALTDSAAGVTYDPVHRPGVSNLIEIVSHLEGVSCEEIARESQHASLRVFKEHVADRITFYLQEIRDRYISLMEDRTDYLENVAEEGAEAARANSQVTMRQLREAMGL